MSVCRCESEIICVDSIGPGILCIVLGGYLHI